MNFFDRAAELCWHGLLVFPIVAGGAVPAIKSWPTLASDDDEVIGGWFAKWPNANVGVACGRGSGVLVVDVDVKNDAGGEQSLVALANAGKWLPRAPEVRTPSGGRHFFFRHVDGIKNIAGVSKSGRGLGRGIDVRTEGGFAVGANSIKPNGVYQWVVPPVDRNYPALPQWAVEMLRQKPEVVKTVSTTLRPTGDDNVDRIVKFVRNLQPGSRNNGLFWAASECANKAPDKASAARELTSTAIAIGMQRDEIKATLASAKLGGFL